MSIVQGIRAGGPGRTAMACATAAAAVRHGMSRLTGAAAAVLVGGEGRRMGGVRKPLLTVQGRRVLDRELEVLDPLFDTVMLLADAAAPFAGFGRRVILDEAPGRGPLPAIAAALRALGRPLFVVAGDMPFLAAAPIELTVRRALASGADVAVPFTGGHPEPLHACYLPSCLAAIEASLAGGQLAVMGFYDRVRLCRVEEPELRALAPDLAFLRNLNTPGALGGG
jgi:molybdopterin-guanine dinucleotide biosynthesis protein A